MPAHRPSETQTLRAVERLVTEALPPDRRGTIRRWAQDYDFARSNQTAAFLEPRGLDAVTSKLAEAKWTYAVTGALGAQRFS